MRGFLRTGNSTFFFQNNQKHGIRKAPVFYLSFPILCIVFLVLFIFSLISTSLSAATITATAYTGGTPYFTVEVVDENDAVVGNGDQYSFGNYYIFDPNPSWAGPVSPRAIRIKFLLDIPPPQGERGAFIYTQNDSDLQGVVHETYLENVLLCWRVFSQFPEPSQMNIYPVLIDEGNIEVCLQAMLVAAGVIGVADVNGDAVVSVGVKYDINGDERIGWGAESKIVFLSDDLYGYIVDGYLKNNGFNVPVPPKPLDWDGFDYPGIVPYYACFLYMLDNDQIELYTGEFTEASYASVLHWSYGIQHAECTFGNWNERTVYVYLGGNFGGDPEGMYEGVYSTDIKLAVYSI